MNMDRISKLPDDLLLQILSSLPTKNAIATSVLSKRWKSLWKMVPKLKFECPYSCVKHIDPSIFAENVNRSLMLHKAPVLESLHLRFDGATDKVDFGIWISTAFARRVRKLVLASYYYQEQQIVVLPSVLFSYNDTLEILELYCGINLCFPSKVCLRSLRKLYLSHIHFKNEESVCNFLCGCPSLEDLVVHRYSNADVGTFTISVPSLKRLTIEVLNRGGGGIYVINVPALKYLNIKGFKLLDSCLIEKVPELVEAKISDVSDMTNENILESLTSAKRLILHLSPLEVKVPTGKIFHQLVSLELCTRVREWWNLLSIMLDSSPKLQILKLTSMYPCPFPDSCEWNQPKCVPECLLFHLETLVWRGYNWQREVEKKVATYVLKHAQRLKTATFSKRKYREKFKSGELRRREKMLNELSSVLRASDSCNLVFEF